jgi:hypothetical protein
MMVNLLKVRLINYIIKHIVEMFDFPDSKGFMLKVKFRIGKGNKVLDYNL